MKHGLIDGLDEKTNQYTTLNPFNWVPLTMLTRAKLQMSLILPQNRWSSGDIFQSFENQSRKGGVEVKNIFFIPGPHNKNNLHSPASKSECSCFFSIDCFMCVWLDNPALGKSIFYRSIGEIHWSPYGLMRASLKCKFHIHSCDTFCVFFVVLLDRCSVTWWPHPSSQHTQTLSSTSYTQACQPQLMTLNRQMFLSVS